MNLQAVIPQASSRPAANLSAVGLSQHAVWKAKIFNVNFVPLPFFKGDSQLELFLALPLLGAGNWRSHDISVRTDPQRHCPTGEGRAGATVLAPELAWVSVFSVALFCEFFYPLLFITSPEVRRDSGIASLNGLV